jgi:hypothetical protein
MEFVFPPHSGSTAFFRLGYVFLQHPHKTGGFVSIDKFPDYYELISPACRINDKIPNQITANN